MDAMGAAYAGTDFPTTHLNQSLTGDFTSRCGHCLFLVFRILPIHSYSRHNYQTHSVAMCFLLAMTKYPEVQKKAQVELDRHVGQHRLPNLEDRASLTYIQAIALECMRWQPTVPLSLPHMTTTDDEYNGYRIPKGTAILSVGPSVVVYEYTC